MTACWACSAKKAERDSRSSANALCGTAATSVASVTSAVEPLAPIGAIVTKIDETEEPLPAMEHADGRDLAIAFLSNGPDIGRHFHRASADRFADVALIGRIG